MRTIFAALLATVMTAALGAPATAAATAVPDPDHLVAHQVVAFDAGAYEYGAFGESIAPDGHGGVVASVTFFTSTDNTGRLYDVRPDGTKTALGGPWALGPYAQLMGVATDDGETFVVVANFAPAGDTSSPANGVFRLTSTGFDRVMTLPPSAFPNGIAVHHDDLYVTDSFGGAVWVGPTDRRSSPTTPWFASKKLDPMPSIGLGANGIAVRDGRVYVTSYAQALVLSVGIGRDGRATDAVVYAKDPTLKRADGIAFDALGRLWVTVNPRVDSVAWTQYGDGSLVVVGRDGTVTTAATPDGSLDYPTQPVVLGGTVVVSNGSYIHGAPSIEAFR